MNVLYPRTITVTRNAYNPVAGQPLEQQVTTVVTGVVARIYLKRDKGFSPPIDFPGHTNTSAPMPLWMIDTTLGDGSLVENDIITDDLGREFKVDAAYFNGLYMEVSTTPTRPIA